MDKKEFLKKLEIELKIAKNNITQKVNKITAKGKKVLKESVTNLFAASDFLMGSPNILC